MKTEYEVGDEVFTSFSDFDPPVIGHGIIVSTTDSKHGKNYPIKVMWHNYKDLPKRGYSTTDHTSTFTATGYRLSRYQELPEEERAPMKLRYTRGRYDIFDFILTL